MLHPPSGPPDLAAKPIMGHPNWLEPSISRRVLIIPSYWQARSPSIFRIPSQSHGLIFFTTFSFVSLTPLLRPPKAITKSLISHRRHKTLPDTYSLTSPSRRIVNQLRTFPLDALDLFAIAGAVARFYTTESSVASQARKHSNHGSSHGGCPSQEDKSHHPCARSDSVHIHHRVSRLALGQIRHR